MNSLSGRPIYSALLLGAAYCMA